jgi:hypothetical protein
MRKPVAVCSDNSNWVGRSITSFQLSMTTVEISGVGSHALSRQVGWLMKD